MRRLLCTCAVILCCISMTHASAPAKKVPMPKRAAPKPPAKAVVVAGWSQDDAEIQGIWQTIQALMEKYSGKQLPPNRSIWDVWNDTDWKAKENIISSETPGTGSVWELSEQFKKSNPALSKNLGDFAEFLGAYMRDYTPLAKPDRVKLVQNMSTLVPSAFGKGNPLAPETIATALSQLMNIAPESYDLISTQISTKLAVPPQAPKKKPMPKKGEEKKLSEAEQLRRARERSAQEAKRREEEEVQIAIALAELDRLKQWNMPGKPDTLVPRVETITSSLPNLTIKIHYLEVLEQEGTDCGFHTAKNLNLLLQFVDGKIDEKSLKAQLISPDPSLFPLEEMRKCTSSITMIDGDDVIKIAGQFYKIPRKRYSLIPDILDSQQTLISKNPKLRFEGLIGIDPYLGDAIKLLRTPQKSVHGFALGDMKVTLLIPTENDPSPFKVEGGHWIAVVVKREGSILDIYVANSLHNRIKHDDRKMVKALIKIIENGDPEALKKAGTRIAV